MFLLRQCGRRQAARGERLKERIYWLPDQHDHMRRPPAGDDVLHGSRVLSQLQVLKETRRRCEHPISGERAAPFLRDPRFVTTRTPGPVALAAVAHQPASVRSASYPRTSRFDASTSAPAPLSIPAPCPRSSTKNSTRQRAVLKCWHELSIRSFVFFWLPR